MSPTGSIFLGIVMAAVIGCSRPQPTPPEVTAEFEALLEGVDVDRPGESAARLTEFRKEHGTYDIVTEVDSEIDRVRSLAAGRYHEARELAREGAFDRAEAMLEDLAAWLPETPDGESAKEHLAFEFHLGKAQWLMVRQRWEESEQVARLLLGRDLTQGQGEQVEAILDSSAHVEGARSQAVRAQARAACRHLTIYLEMKYAEDGQYPSRLSLADVEEWDPVGSRSILRALSSIENYQSTDGGVSFTAVSADGRHRIGIVDGAIEE